MQGIASTACVSTQATKRSISDFGEISVLKLVGAHPLSPVFAPPRLEQILERSKMNNRERKIDLHVYLSEYEDQVLTAKVKLAGKKSKADYLRQMILDGFVYEIDFSEIRRFNYLLSNVSNNINQIAHKANATDSIFREDVEDLKKEMAQLWQLQRSMLSKLPLTKQ